jgi:hypothetical protein
MPQSIPSTIPAPSSDKEFLTSGDIDLVCESLVQRRDQLKFLVSALQDRWHDLAGTSWVPDNQTVGFLVAIAGPIEALYRINKTAHLIHIGAVGTHPLQWYGQLFYDDPYSNTEDWDLPAPDGPDLTIPYAMVGE